jgi:predicted protein tyrosine phosphatase
MNAMWNCHNPNQGDYIKVLTVCSAGLLRSPTIAWYLNKHWDFNCRAVGVYDYALVPVDEVLIDWADWIICVDKEKARYVIDNFGDYIGVKKQVIYLDIPDIYGYRDPKLVKIIEEQLAPYLIIKEENGN